MRKGKLSTVDEVWPEEILLGILLDARPELRVPEGGDRDEPQLWLHLWVLVGPQGKEVELGLWIDLDPYEMAGELAGAADECLHRMAVADGLRHQRAEAVRRDGRKRERRARREAQQALAEALDSPCDFCRKPVAFVVEGARLCKRHAEELGVRPSGKIGGPEPGELPEEEVPE